jgi:hypothetical protein
MIGYLTPRQQQQHAARRAPAVRALPGDPDADVTARIFVPGRRLGEVLRESEVSDQRGGLGRIVSGIVCDSRCVEPGNIYFDLPGAASDGGHSVAEAISRGASAVVCTRLPIVPQPLV